MKTPPGDPHQNSGNQLSHPNAQGPSDSHEATGLGTLHAVNPATEAESLSLCRLPKFGARQWFKKCPLLAQVAGRSAQSRSGSGLGGIEKDMLASRRNETFMKTDFYFIKKPKAWFWQVRTPVQLETAVNRGTVGKDWQAKRPKDPKVTSIGELVKQGEKCKLCGLWIAQLGADMCNACCEAENTKRAEEAARVEESARAEEAAKQRATSAALLSSAQPNQYTLFYYKVRDEAKGPYTLKQLTSMWEHGQITADALHRTSDSSEWFPLMQRFAEMERISDAPDSAELAVGPPSRRLQRNSPVPQTAEAGGEKKSALNAKKGCLGCLGIIVLLIIIGAIFSPSHSSNNSSPTRFAGHSTSGSPSNSKLVGVYECPSPMWALQLNSDGSYVMEARESGSSFRGTWSASGSSGLLEGTYPSKATMTFTIQSDGAIVVDKYGYTFVRTR